MNADVYIEKMSLIIKTHQERSISIITKNNQKESLYED